MSEKSASELWGEVGVQVHNVLFPFLMGLDTQDLRNMFDHELTRTNCWWISFQFSPMVKVIIRDLLHLREFKGEAKP